MNLAKPYKKYTLYTESGRMQVYECMAFATFPYKLNFIFSNYGASRTGALWLSYSKLVIADDSSYSL